MSDIEVSPTDTDRLFSILDQLAASGTTRGKEPITERITFDDALDERISAAAPTEVRLYVPTSEAAAAARALALLDRSLRLGAGAMIGWAHGFRGQSALLPLGCCASQR